MTRGEEPLLQATVDVESVGERWPDALVMLIEKHEQKHRYVASRSVARRLMERYAAEYFSAAQFDIPARQRAIALLRSRKWGRESRFWHAMRPSDLAARPV